MRVLASAQNDATSADRGAIPTIPADTLLAISIGASLVLWITSLPRMDPDAVNDFGIVSILPWQYWSALVILSMGFAISLTRPIQFPGLRIAALIVLILVLHATPAIVYGTLRYSWAWKHIGIVDYIQRHDGVDRSISVLGAYHNWPFFFWISAKIANLFSLGPAEIANVVRFFSVVSNITFLFLLRGIYARFTTDDRLINASLWVFLCANWVGQDYFSPQAFAYALYLLVILLCLGPLMPADEPGISRIGRRLSKIRARLTHLVPLAQPPSGRHKALSVIVLSVALMAIVASHQLTPLILVFSLTTLSVVTPLSIFYPALAGLMFAYWVTYPAFPFTAIYLPAEVDQLGQTVKAATEKMVDTTNADLGVAIVAWAGRALTVGVIPLGGLGWLRRLWMGERDGISCALLIAPMLILGVTSYGGEAVFRIFFFSLPFISFFCAGFFFPTARRKAGRKTAVAFGILSILLSIGFLFANNGKDRQYHFSQDEVEAAFWLYSRCGPDTLLVEGARSYPSQFMNYENVTYLPIANETPDERADILADPASVLNRWFSDERWKDGYVILTRSQSAYVEALGIMPVGSVHRLALDLLASPDFVLVFASENAWIFRSARF